MSNSTLATTPLFDGLDETLILQRLDVYNWGPFARSHSVEIDAAGTSIIGPTGSGKTTLVDALMTLIVANPKYNLASTGGHDSDRDLMSYVRGVLGHGNDSGDTSHISRPGRTVTGLAARFARPGRSITLAALLWTDGTSMSAADCKKRWLISEDDGEELEHWLNVHHNGGARALKSHCEQRHRLTLFETKRTYLARVRRLFDISENAFDLLNRAAGLKQLDSVDQIFRDLVLDDRSGFKRAAQVASEFDDLAGIRAELETARRQQRSLQPLVKLNEEHQRVTDEHQERLAANHLLTRWFAHAGAKLWAERVAGLDDELASLHRKRDLIDVEVERLQGITDELRVTYLEVGGADREALDERIRHREQTLTDQRRRHDDYAQVVSRLRAAVDLAVDPPGEEATAEELASVQAEARRLRPTLDDAFSDREERFKVAAARVGTATSSRTTTTDELDRIKSRPGSNIPVADQDFRAELADAIGLDEANLPFLAELVSVKAEEKAWRGAIERALGGHRLRLLVPKTVLDEALRWVNDHHTGRHVRLEAAASRSGAGLGREPFADSFLHKLDLKSHPLRSALWDLLLSIDRHCVSSPEALRSVQHGMTREGLLSGRSGRFEKHDRYRLDQGWLTGFDNLDQLATLSTRLDELTEEVATAETEYKAADRERENFRRSLELLDDLGQLKFDDIDVASARQAVNDLEQRRALLDDPTTKVGKAHQQLVAATAELGSTRQEAGTIDRKIGSTEAGQRQANSHRREAEEQAGTELSVTDRQLAAAHLPDLTNAKPESLLTMERACGDEIDAQITSLRDRSEKLGQLLVKQLGDAKKEDTGELADAGTDLVDIPTYLERLRVLTDEALPKRQRRFLEYLNQSSDQGVSSLLATIEAEVDTITTRIDDLNRTLEKVDYQPGRHLRLRPQRVVQQALQDLQRAQKTLAAARLTDDHGEAQYRALEKVIEMLRQASDNKTTVWARALLDPRHRLTFSVAVLDRASGRTVEVRTSSEGGSGGEKEIIASYILTASLSYALCPDGAAQPLFGTIVLDEAFSKSSQTVAARIIDALDVFGLHPLFVTPNKELTLLRANTRSAILVNKNRHESKLVSISWEELDRRRPQSGPVADLDSDRSDADDRAAVAVGT